MRHSALQFYPTRIFYILHYIIWAKSYISCRLLYVKVLQRIAELLVVLYVYHIVLLREFVRSLTPFGGNGIENAYKSCNIFPDDFSAILRHSLRYTFAQGTIRKNSNSYAYMLQRMIQLMYI